MTPDPNRPRRESIVYGPEYARAMGMSEEARLQFAAGNYHSLDEVIRILEAEFGPFEDDLPKPDPEHRPEPETHGEKRCPPTRPCPTRPHHAPD